MSKEALYWKQVDKNEKLAKEITDLKAQVAERDAVIEVALEEVYQREIIDTDMYDIEIGHGNFTKEDWIENKKTQWEYEAKAKEGE